MLLRQKLSVKFGSKFAYRSTKWQLFVLIYLLSKKSVLYITICKNDWSNNALFFTLTAWFVIHVWHVWVFSSAVCCIIAPSIRRDDVAVMTIECNEFCEFRMSALCLLISSIWTCFVRMQCNKHVCTLFLCVCDVLRFCIYTHSTPFIFNTSKH